MGGVSRTRRARAHGETFADKREGPSEGARVREGLRETARTSLFRMIKSTI